MATGADLRAGSGAPTGLGLRGALAVALALATGGMQVLAVLMPVVTAAVIGILIGAYALVEGVLAIAFGLRSRQPFHWWVRWQGVLGILVGGVLLSRMAAPGRALLYVIAAWAIATGIIELAASRHLSSPAARKLLSAAAVISLVFGAVVFIAWPGPGLLPFMWLFIVYTLAVGVLRITAAFR